MQNKYEIAISLKQRPQRNFNMVNNTIINLRVRKTKNLYTLLLMDIFKSIDFFTNICNYRTTKSSAPLEIYCFHDYHTFQFANHMCPFPKKQMQPSPINYLWASQHFMSIHNFDNSTNFNYDFVQINSYNNLAHPKKSLQPNPFSWHELDNSKDCGHTSLQTKRPKNDILW